MKEKLTNNWALKLISVGLAVFLWLWVINEDNPMVSKNITVHNVKYLNEEVITEDNKTYSVESLETKGIGISVKVRSQDSNKVKADDFQIVIDLAQMGPYGAVEVSVEWLGSDQYKIEESDISWKTTTVQVTLEDIMTKTYAVEMSVVGEPAEGYIVGSDRQVTPRSVKITAPMSVIEKIRTVGIVVDVSDLNSEASGTARLKLYDVAGEELNLDYSAFEDYEFSVSTEDIAYTVPLLKTKEVGLRFSGVTGEVAEGYRYTDILGRNQTVHIAGLRATLADVDEIDIPAEALNLDGAAGNVEIQLDLSQYVPEGVTIESDSIVTVTLVVEPLVLQTKYLTAGDIRLEDGLEGWSYSVRGTVEVVIEGLEEDLNALTADMLDAWISLSGMAAGSNTAEVHVTVGSAFTLIDVGEATVVMDEISQSQESSSGNTAGSTTGNTSGNTGGNASGNTGGNTGGNGTGSGGNGSSGSGTETTQPGDETESSSGGGAD